MQLNPGWAVPHTGRGVVFTRNGILFCTQWDKDVDKTKISLGASISFKVDNERSVNIACDKLLRVEPEHRNYGSVVFKKMVNIDLESLYDTERFISAIC